jgi:hypothetical protein
MHFLFSRYQQQRELRQQDLFREKTVADYLFQKDRIFANLNLSDKELALYEKVVGWLELEVTRPDVVVYLQASTETLMERVAKRGRPFERDMDRQYMQALNDSYNYFFFHYVEAPLLVVNTNGIDFVKNRADLEDLEARILAHHEGTTYYTPLPSKESRKLARLKEDVALEPPSPEIPGGAPLFEAPPEPGAPPLSEAVAPPAPPARRPRATRPPRDRTRVPE